MSGINPSAIVMPDGWNIQLTNSDHDNFCACRTAITATRPDGKRRCWTIPDRLLRRPDVISIVVEELFAELAELP